jgi:hypothetical protein
MEIKFIKTETGGGGDILYQNNTPIYVSMII